MSYYRGKRVCHVTPEQTRVGYVLEWDASTVTLLIPGEGDEQVPAHEVEEIPRRTVGRAAPRQQETSHRIYEDVQRGWRGEQKATDAQMNVVLEILLERGEALQAEIAEELGVRLELKKGTAGAATSGALLHFREAGWVEHVRDEGRAAIWRIVE